MGRQLPYVAKFKRGTKENDMAGLRKRRKAFDRHNLRNANYIVKDRLIGYSDNSIKNGYGFAFYPIFYGVQP